MKKINNYTEDTMKYIESNIKYMEDNLNLGILYFIYSTTRAIGFLRDSLTQKYSLRFIDYDLYDEYMKYCDDKDNEVYHLVMALDDKLHNNYIRKE